LTVVLLVVAIFALGVAQAVAKSDNPVGEQINLFGPPAMFSAGDPIHVQHGWGLIPLVETPGRTAFELELDGVMLGKADHKVFVHVKDLPFSLVRHWGYNFPDGLSAGEHSLMGHWCYPCEAAVEQGYPGACKTPNELVEVLSLEAVIEFEQKLVANAARRAGGAPLARWIGERPSACLLPKIAPGIAHSY
jgi:hypothetical protein